MQCSYGSKCRLNLAVLPNCRCTVLEEGDIHLYHEGVWLGAVQDSGEGHMLRAPIGSLDHFVGAIPVSTKFDCWVYTHTQTALETLQW